MVSKSPFKDHPHPLRKKILPYTLLFALLPIAFIRLYFYPISVSPPVHHKLSSNHPILISKSPPPPPPPQEVEKSNLEIESCDYTNGKWVHDKVGPLYNGTTCGTIKEGQNCMTHGRPDVGYLYWRWRPKKCPLPRFDPNTFLQLIKNKHLAFVGDSMARNQLESLLCMLSTASNPNLVYTAGEDNKFRRWHFPSHNASVSIYWSPFLVEGIEKSENVSYNRLYLDRVNERWASDLGHIDMIVLSIGHWYLHPAVYFDGDSVLGCHSCSGQNYSEIGFFDVYGKAIKTTLKAIMDRRGKGGSNGIDVIVTTFSPAHFEGEWDKFGACSKTKPYDEEEKRLEGMDADMRNAEVKEVEEAKESAKGLTSFRLEAVDVTKLALLRPDGHPGPYMYPFPFANGIQEHVQNDCVHWCLPGPIDTWNEILLDVVKRWKGQSWRSG